MDASAIVKLVVEEPEHLALVAELARFERRVSSELLVAEVGRAGSRALGEPGLHRAEVVCESVDLIALDRVVLDRAASLGPPELRTLDAIHLATALLAPRPPVVVAYDGRLLAAARTHGLPTLSPGRGG